MDERILAVVRKNVCLVMDGIDPEKITIDAAMADLGCNSIDRAEVVTMTMEDLGVTVPVMAFQPVRDIRGLVSVLRAHV